VTREKPFLPTLRFMSAGSQVSVVMFHVSPLFILNVPPNIRGFPLNNTMADPYLGYLSEATSRADPVVESNISVLQWCLQGMFLNFFDHLYKLLYVQNLQP